MTAPQATPACAIGLPGSFTGVSESEVPHAVAGPIAARNDLAAAGRCSASASGRLVGEKRCQGRATKEHELSGAGFHIGGVERAFQPFGRERGNANDIGNYDSFLRLRSDQ